MKQSLLLIISIVTLFTNCKTDNPEYFRDEDLIVVKVLAATQIHHLKPSTGRSLLLQRVKNPAMMTELHEDGLRVRTARMSYRVGDTIRVTLNNKSLFFYSSR